jgi:hypothetical protein
MTKDEALTLALKALETSMYPQQKQLQAITAIKEALAQPQPCLYVKDIGGNFHLLKEKGHTENCMPLADDVRNHLPPSHSELVEKIVAQPEQEPVGYWMGEFNDGGAARLYEVPQESVFGRTYRNIPVYTTPPQRKPLTEQKIGAILEDTNAFGTRLYTFARAIEAAHGIKD